MQTHFTNLPFEVPLMDSNLKSCSSNKNIKKSLCIIFCISIQNSASAQLSVQPDRLHTRYEIGETAYFRVSGAQNGTISYEIKHTLIDTLPLLGSGTAQVVNGVATIPYTSSLPRFVICKVLQNNQMAYSSASFSPEKLQPIEEEPADLDAFWAARKAEVRATPMDVQMRYVRTNEFSNTFIFDISIVDGKRIYGYLIVPISLVGSYPAVIHMPSYGAAANLVYADLSTAERAGMLAVFLTAHNNLPTVSAAATDYLTEGIAQPQSYYLKYILLGAVKVMDYLQTRPDFNGQVATFGISQGGGLAGMLAGIDNRIKILMQAYPAFCHQVASKYRQPSAFPYTYNTTARLSTATQETALSTLKYYDPVYLLRRFNGVSWSAASLKDDVCPPQPVLTAVNQLKGQRIVESIFNRTHTQGPDEFFNSGLNNTIYAFLRRHFPACRRAPWLYNPTTKGYVIEAGQNQVLDGNVASLNGYVGVNDTIAGAFPVRWEQVGGNQKAVFFNAYDRNTTVNFPEIGTYRLRFSAIDYSTTMDHKYYYLSNDVEITVNTVLPEIGFSRNKQVDNLQLFPNPASETLTLRLAQSENADDTTVKIYDVWGRLQMVDNMDRFEKTLNINALHAGAYWIEIKNEHLMRTLKFFKQ